MTEKLTTIDYVHRAVANLNNAHALADSPETMRTLAKSRHILEELLYVQEHGREEPEFPVYVGWDGQEHAEF